MRLKPFSWGTIIILFAAVTALLSGCALLNEPQALKSEFRALCNNIAKSLGGLKITRDEFVAASNDKNKAEKAFNICNVNEQSFITEKDIDLMKMEELKIVLAESKDETSALQNYYVVIISTHHTQPIPPGEGVARSPSPPSIFTTSTPQH
jgi:hypothetical protein